MKKHCKSLLLLLLSVSILLSCSHKTKIRKHIGNNYVKIANENGLFQLIRNGKPYFIKGACIYNSIKLIKETGGNSIRVYNVNSDSALAILDRAYASGLTVTLGLNIAFAGALDYSDEKAVENQLKRIKKDVQRLKNHPALLMWGVGNELNSKIESENIFEHYRLWRAVNDIAKMIHEVDPNHPTNTMISSNSFHTMRHISWFCDEIDVLSVNVFREMPDLQNSLIKFGWEGPFIISEYGTIGHWNVPRTDWYAKMEPTSFSKAQELQMRYHELVNLNKSRCLGSYVFIWGQKQEYTSTWFSLFTEIGQTTEMIDALQYLWTNKWPLDHAPSILSLKINHTKGSKNIYLPTSTKFQTTLVARDLENDSLQLRWEIQKDNVEMFFDGKVAQAKPEIISQGNVKYNILKKYNKKVENGKWKEYYLNFIAPTYEGPYRLFIYLTDSNNKTATSNTPFYVYD